MNRSLSRQKPIGTDGNPRWRTSLAVVGLLAANVASAQGGLYTEGAAAPVSPRIIGGEPAPADAYPWMVALLDSATESAFNGQFCGASLVRSDWVLTAAHCVEGSRPGDIDVLLGQVDLNGSGGERIDVDEVVVHPDYVNSGFPDVALLRLAQPSERTPVGLASSGSGVDAPGTLATTLGWGLTEEDNPNSIPSLLQEVSVPIVPGAVCAQRYGDELVDSAMICAGLPQGGKDSCQGDSGGPLVVKDPQTDNYLQSGVTSFGDGCARPNAPGVYARVSAVNEWIDETIGDASAPDDPAPEDPDTPLSAALSVQCDALVCDFDASGSTSDVAISFYVWSFGDGQWAFGERVQHDYAVDGDYNVMLHVLAEDGRIATDSDSIVVEGDPKPEDGSKHFNGTLKSIGDEALLPEDGFRAAAGPLKASLVGPDDADFDLLIEQFDEEIGEWTLVDYAASEDSMETLSISLREEGLYRFAVVSYAGRGEFSLSATIGGAAQN